MRRGLNLLMTMVFAAAMILAEVRGSLADERAPDPKMLMNLDLFAARSNPNSVGQAASSDSMLSQIRALRAMGYLNGHAPAGPQPVGNPAPPAPVPGPQPSQVPGLRPSPNNLNEILE
jgi:hypothetical protein